MTRTHQQLLDLVRTGLLGQGQGDVPALPAVNDAADIVARNRMAPLMFLLTRQFGLDAERDWVGLDTVYRQATVHQARSLQTGLQLADALDSAGIPCLCYRGPFAGLHLYGDFASRPFIDIDLIVPDDRAEEAREIARREGFGSQQEGVPPGFFRRHHIHWALRKGETLLDLHWAVEHPYTLYRIDYPALFAESVEVAHQGHTWRQPAPHHLFLLCCLQLTKSEPRAMAMARDPDCRHLFDTGLLFKWLDLALMWRRGDIDVDALLAAADAWRARRGLAAGLVGMQRFFGIPAPDALLQDLADSGDCPDRLPAYDREPRGPNWLHGLVLRRGGFRLSRLRDVATYLLPPADYFPGNGPSRVARRATHFFCGFGRMSFALADGAWTLGLRDLIVRRKPRPDSSLVLRST